MPPTISGAALEKHDASADNRAQENGEKCSRLDQRVAGNELFFAQVLGQQRVFDRAEHGRMRAEAEQRRSSTGMLCCHRPQAPIAMIADFRDFDPSRDRRLVHAIGQRSGGAREEEERRDEQAAGDHHQ